MSDLRRRLYGGIVRLHPAAFREEFGREMTLDFEEALKSHGFAALCCDALLSVGRQWGVFAFPAAEQGSIARPALLAGDYVMVAQSCLTFFDLARASVLSCLLFLALGFGTTTSHSSRAAGLQAGAASQRGTGAASPGGDEPSTGGRRSFARNESRAADTGEAHLRCTDRYDFGPCAAAMAGERPSGYIRRTLSNSITPTHPGRQINTGVLRESLAELRQVAGMDAVSSIGPVWSRRLWQANLSALLVGLATWLLFWNPSVTRKMVLVGLGLLALGAPMAFGMVRMTAMHGQILHASGALPSFEVVSIRPWQPPPMPPPAADGMGARPKGPMKVDPGSGGEHGQRTDRVHMILPVGMLIKSAYGLQPSSPEFSGGPDWLWQNSPQYEIQAKIEGSLFAAMQTMTSEQQREQVDLMEQALLVDRFKLKVHFETREMPVYALTIAKGGAKLAPAKAGEMSHMADTRENEQGTETAATALTMDQLAHSTLLFDGKTVVNQTGLKGAYDFTLTWASDRQLTAGADAPALFAAIQEQLGLRLMQTKAPMEVIVIDHIEKPSEN